MGITMFTLGGLFTRLQAFMAWLAPSPRRVDQTAAASRIAPAIALAHATRRVAPARVPALRVVRVMESSSAPSGAGRMFMSGRMSDVCAELDRLAALEAAAG
jgi:hypothetical protein